MQTTFALAALAALAAMASAAPSPQGVTADIPAPGYPPPGAITSYSGPFEVTIVSANLAKRQAVNCGQDGYLTVTLTNGVLTDSHGRTGYIASNYQFQFDAPPQAGAIYTGGFSIFPNTSLALGSSAVFYECASGSFSNLYNKDWAPHCLPILIDILPCGSSGAANNPAVATLPASQITDGQPKGPTNPPTVPVSEYTDGQPQVLTVGPRPVSQISDGQIQIPTGVPVSQISDGQIQATTKASGVPVSQISDGQVQATRVASGVPVSQISDGQIQATTKASGVPVSQISDGQIQATTVASRVPVSQISDGQIQAVTKAPNTTSLINPTNLTITHPTPTTSAVPVTAAGNGLNVASSFAGLVGLVAMLLL